MSSGVVYKIRSDKPEDWVHEINNILVKISNRLDAIEGHRGRPKFYNYIEATNDVVVTDSLKGVVLRDTGDPANYWRIRVSTTGTISATNIGRSYP